MNDPAAQDEFVLELYVQGQSAQSNSAVETVTRICEERLRGRYRLDVIEIHQQPERTRNAQVVAAPALLRLKPAPVVRAVGRLSEARVLEILGLDERLVGLPDEP